MTGADTVFAAPAGSPVRLGPVALSLFVSSLAGIAEEMGAVLVHSSYSPNIKERRDCSCALYDASGRMFAQAEHIPVHLGAMHDSVRAVRERAPGAGDVFILNDPYTGGTHLPDITVVTPVDIDGEVIAYAVSRAHHSDVGGMSPGSMPSNSRTIFQEGIIIPPVRLVKGGVFVTEVLDLLLANVRTPEVRRVDLLAQIAANRVGSERLCTTRGALTEPTFCGPFSRKWWRTASDARVGHWKTCRTGRTCLREKSRGTG